MTFVAFNARGAERYIRLLQQMGVETYAGRYTINAGSEYLYSLETLIGTQVYDLAILFFWSAAHEYLPLLRQLSPRTQVLIDSMDLNFLRRAREHLLVGQDDKNGLQSFEAATRLSWYGNRVPMRRRMGCWRSPRRRRT